MNQAYIHTVFKSVFFFVTTVVKKMIKSKIIELYYLFNVIHVFQNSFNILLNWKKG